MLAVIKTGGKQYLVTPGQKIKIEKINKKEGDKIVFSEVLLLEKNKPGTRAKLGAGPAPHRPAESGTGVGKVEIGTPLVKDVKVIGKILRHGKGKKLIVFKYRAKTRYKKKKGHRQAFTEVEITKIET